MQTNFNSFWEGKFWGKPTVCLLTALCVIWGELYFVIYCKSLKRDMLLYEVPVLAQPAAQYWFWRTSGPSKKQTWDMFYNQPFVTSTIRQKNVIEEREQNKAFHMRDIVPVSCSPNKMSKKKKTRKRRQMKTDWGFACCLQLSLHMVGFVMNSCRSTDNDVSTTCSHDAPGEGRSLCVEGGEVPCEQPQR